MNSANLHRQSGAAAIVMLYGLLTIGVLGFAITISILMVCAFLNGRWRYFGIAIICAGWGAVIHTNYILPFNESEAERRWRVAAYEICESEIPKLPQRIEIDDLFDEGAAFGIRSIAHLFDWRGLRYLDIRVSRHWDWPPQIARGGNPSEGWTVDQPVGRIARLELGSRSEGHECANPPLAIRHIDGKPPFLPDTCFRLTYSDTPTAKYRLMLDPADPIGRTKYGKWRLVDSASGTELASLTTVDVPGKAVSGNLLESHYPRSNDCRSPHGIIADRIFAPKRSADLERYLLKEKQVLPRPPIQEVSLRVEEFSKIAFSGSTIKFSTETAKDQLLNAEGPSGWSEAVAYARKHGYGAYGKRSIDWKNNELVTLDLRIDKTKSTWPWETFGILDGFLVTSSKEWAMGEPNLLARYSADGEFIWAVGVVMPLGFPPLSCKSFRPRAIKIEGNELRLYDSCDKESGVVLSIPTTSLPRKKIQLTKYESDN